MERRCQPEDGLVALRSRGERSDNVTSVNDEHVHVPRVVGFDAHGSISVWNTLQSLDEQEWFL